uniref:Uncharacterized protein n=1 Tax=Strongyloides papillosus TaxID=174720 RepID=A0A0N5B9Q1_STREA
MLKIEWISERRLSFALTIALTRELVIQIGEKERKFCDGSEYPCAKLMYLLPLDEVQIEICKAKLKKLSDGCLEFINSTSIECHVSQKNVKICKPYNVYYVVRHIGLAAFKQSTTRRSKNNKNSDTKQKTAGTSKKKSMSLKEKGKKANGAGGNGKKLSSDDGPKKKPSNCGVNNNEESPKMENGNNAVKSDGAPEGNVGDGTTTQNSNRKPNTFHKLLDVPNNAFDCPEKTKKNNVNSYTLK